MLFPGCDVYKPYEIVIGPVKVNVGLDEQPHNLKMTSVSCHEQRRLPVSWPNYHPLGPAASAEFRHFPRKRHRNSSSQTVITPLSVVWSLLTPASSKSWTASTQSFFAANAVVPNNKV